MKIKVRSRIRGSFEGWDGDSLFQFENGQVWKQAKYQYKYVYKYRPRVEILQDGSRYFLKVESVNELIQVIRIH
ncbi:hypothetical protein [Halobacteriovorax sp. BALOs_7]|uniref:hypothetical protein n=1 Tax=Halobacteriovorax sp. BALOs_7 TaxID=2109558 RepID=UPI000EA2CFAA|nr:hypothetical protein [Halobacteriovorax sp. BALOs_7]